MWHQFMSKRNNSNVQFMSNSVKGSMRTHVTSVHEQNKPLKRKICDHTYSQKGHMKTHVHEENKLFKCEICIQLWKDM